MCAASAYSRASADTVAVMQPYFFPYAGYFRLMAAAGTFVFLDCVQFPRRGRVHRCEVPGARGAIEWLTLPLARQPQNVLIRDLAYAENAKAELERRLSRYHWFRRANGPLAARVRDLLLDGMTCPADDLVRQLITVSSAIGFSPHFVRSSSLAIDPAVRGQARILAIVKTLGGRRYVNAPGGRKLYEQRAFEASGMQLGFLAPYMGPFNHMLPTLLDVSPSDVGRNVLETTHVEWF